MLLPPGAWAALACILPAWESRASGYQQGHRQPPQWKASPSEPGIAWLTTYDWGLAIYYGSQWRDREGTWGLPPSPHMGLGSTVQSETQLSAVRLFLHELAVQRSFLFKNSVPDTSLVFQWLRPCTPNAGGPGSIPGQGTRPHMPQLSSHAATKTENPTGHNYDPGQPNK